MGQELVDQHEVVLHVLLRDLAEVGLHHVAHLQQELEHHRRVHVLLRHRSQPERRNEIQLNFRGKYIR